MLTTSPVEYKKHNKFDRISPTKDKKNNKFNKKISPKDKKNKKDDKVVVMILNYCLLLSIVALCVTVINLFASAGETEDRKTELENDGYSYVETFPEFPNPTLVKFKVEKYCDNNEYLITNDSFKVVNKNNFKGNDSLKFLLYCK